MTTDDLLGALIIVALTAIALVWGAPLFDHRPPRDD